MKENSKEYLLRTYPEVISNYNSKYLNYLESFKDRGIKKEPGFEVHHIIPKVYFKDKGIKVDNSEDNLVKLTMEEHIKAYLLLSLENPNMTKSFWGVINFRFDLLNHSNLFTFNDIETILEEKKKAFLLSREKTFKTKSSDEWKQKFKGIMHDYFSIEGVRDSYRESMKSMLSKMSKEDILKKENKRIRYLKSDETRKKMSESQKKFLNENPDKREILMKRWETFRPGGDILSIEKLSSLAKERWKDDSYRESIVSKIRDYYHNEDNLKKHKERMNNPETKKKCSLHFSLAKKWIIITSDEIKIINNLSLYIRDNFDKIIRVDSFSYKKRYTEESLFQEMSSGIAIYNMAALEFSEENFKYLSSKENRLKFLKEREKTYLSKLDIHKIYSEAQKVYNNKLSEEEKISRRNKTKESLNTPKAREFFNKKSEVWRKYKDRMIKGLVPTISWNEFSSKYKTNYNEIISLIKD